MQIKIFNLFEKNKLHKNAFRGIISIKIIKK